MFIKKFISFLIVFCLLFNLVFAQQVVEVKQAEEKNGLSLSLSLFKSPIFLGIVFIVIIVIILGILGVALIRWFIKWIKLRSDIFYKMKQDRVKLAKTHSRYPKDYWWNIDKNIPIRIVKNNEDGNLDISKPIAYYRGDYISHEGNLIMAINIKNKKKWFVIPITDLLIFPKKDKIKLVQRDGKGKKIKEEIIQLPNADKILKFNTDEIFLYANGISNTGSFYVPVLKSNEGKIIDLSMPVYQTLKDVVLEDYLYEQTSEFVGIAKKSMDLNPHARYIQKTSDVNSSVEVPQGSMNR